jgi:hypothetical protein
VESVAASLYQAPPDTDPITPMKQVRNVFSSPQTEEIRRKKIPTSLESISSSPRSTTDSSSTGHFVKGHDPRGSPDYLSTQQLSAWSSEGSPFGDPPDTAGRPQGVDQSAKLVRWLHVNAGAGSRRVREVEGHDIQHVGVYRRLGMVRWAGQIVAGHGPHQKEKASGTQRCSTVSRQTMTLPP